MENLSPWKLIKAGFLLGLGFIIPLLLVNITVLGISISSMYSNISGYDEFEDLDENYPDFSDHADDILLGDYHFTVQGNQLLIHGSLKNTGQENINNIELEAELFDGKTQFVFECSEYMNSKLKPEQIENFQIQCGCGDNGLPEFESIKIKVNSASVY